MRKKKTPQTTSRLAYVNKLLGTAKVAAPPVDGTIGIGTSFDIVLTDGETSETRHYEMINHAVSDELEDTYAERIDSLGSKLYGLKQNDITKYRKNGKTYKVAGMNVEANEPVKINIHLPHHINIQKIKKSLLLFLLLVKFSVFYYNDKRN